MARFRLPRRFSEVVGASGGRRSSRYFSSMNSVGTVWARFTSSFAAFT
jgi:hypothetical protein